MFDNDSYKISASPEVMARAQKVGPKASIREVTLLEIRAKRGDLTSEFPTQTRSVRGHSFRRENQSGEIFVSVRFGCDVAYDSEESKKNPAVTLEATFGLRYTVQDIATFEDDDLDAFSQINGFFNSWPYWRELHHSVTGRMGILFPPLPTMRIAEKKDEPATTTAVALEAKSN